MGIFLRNLMITLLVVVIGGCSSANRGCKAGKGDNVRIPILMSHGIVTSGEKTLTVEQFRNLMKIAKDMGFESINYDDLYNWQQGKGNLPKHPIMIDFDHPERSILHEIKDVMKEFGFKGNLFINTGAITETDTQTWNDVREIVKEGWHIGAHTVTHPDLSKLSIDDPNGVKLRWELDESDRVIKEELGITPRDFAFTGTSLSTLALEEVSKRYRFGRLWIISKYYNMDGKQVRYADLVGIAGEDEADGGPPMAARYIYKNSNPYLLPSMEIMALIYEPDAFTAYLKGALEYSGEK